MTEERSESGAVIDGLYRYMLWRRWGPEPPMVWIMLNPSTADGEEDDQTIRKCMAFARREGCGGIEVINLFALRATNPKALALHEDPEGPFNTTAWQLVLERPHGPIVGAWGAHNLQRLPRPRAFLQWRHQLVVEGFYCLGTTASGEPRHPSRLGYDTPLEPVGKEA